MTARNGRVLVVDDEPQMLDIVSFALETQSFEVDTAPDAETAWGLFECGSYQLAVLDVMLPGESGVDLCRRIREAGSTPVLLLTARSDVRDRIAGLEAGADDYVIKPFHPRELALRAEAIVRRTAKTASSMRIGELVIGPSQVTVGGKLLPLTTTERALLTALVKAQGQATPTGDLLYAGWQIAEGPGAREMLKTAIYRLRRQLRDAGVPLDIVAVRGLGYCLQRADPTTVTEL